MSTTIDQRVAELRFDNSHFEKNVSTSMSTLDKLKQKLNLTGASKGLTDVGVAAGKINLNPLCNAAESVSLKFNAMYTIADQVLRNITNSAMNTGKQLVKSLSIDQITAGWGKYDEKTASVQTIMNATGLSIDEVNGYLDKLMSFSDETSYGFNDMTAALAQMTSSGGDIKNLIPLITGVANATAYAGKGASEFSRVMYNLNQSYGRGYLELMDWKSVELAGVGSKQLKQVLIDTAVAMGKIKEGDVDLGSFANSLKDKWADTEVMEAAFGKFAEFSDAVFRFMDGDLDGFSDEIKALYDPDASYTASEAMELLSDRYDELGVKAFTSAQEAKSFTEAIEATKDAVSSGWMKTFEIIFGDYEKAKELWTDVANVLWDLFAAGGEVRNAILNNALTKNFEGMMNKIRSIFDPVKDTIDGVKKSLVDYDKVVDEIIRGDWGNMQARWDALSAAGYDWAHAQNLVNERLGCSVRHATNYTEAADEVTETTAYLNEEQTKLIKSLLKMSDAQLKEAGYTDEQIEGLRELEKMTNKLGMSVDDFLANVDEMDGRWILINSFKNLGSSILKILDSIKQAWNDVFGMSEEEAGEKLFDLIAAFHKLSMKLRMSDETAEKLRNTFKGLFAVLDIVRMIVAGPIKLAITVVSKILSFFGLTILDVTSYIGNLIYQFRNWLKENQIFNQVFNVLINLVKNAAVAFWNLDGVQKVFNTLKNAFLTVKDVVSNGFMEWLSSMEKLVTGVQNGSISFSQALDKFGKSIKNAILKIPFVKTIVKWVKAFAALPEVQNFINSLKNTLVSFKNTVTNKFGNAFEHIKKTISDSREIGRNLIQGLQNGMKDGTIKIKDAIIQLAKFVINTFKNLLGIHSPSTVFFTIGGFIIAGLLGGLLSSSGSITSFFTNLGGNITGIISKIPWGKLFVGGMGVGVLTIGTKLASAFKAITSPLQGFGDLLSSMSGVLDKSGKSISKVIKSTTSVVKGAGKVLKSVSNYINAQAFKSIAVALAILVAGIVVLTLIDPKKTWAALGAIAALMAVVGTLAIVVGKFGPKTGVDFAKVALSILELSASVLIIAWAMKVLSNIDSANMGKAILGLFAVVGSVVLLIGALTICLSRAKSMEKVDEMLKNLGECIVKVAGLIAVLGILPTNVIVKGELAILGIVGIMALLMLLTKIGKFEKTEGMLGNMGEAIAKIAALVSVLGLLPVGVIVKGELALLGIVGILALLMLISKIAKFQKEGEMLVKMAEAIAVLAGVVSILGLMPIENIVKGELALLGLTGIIALLMWITKTFGKYAANIGKTVLQLSFAIAVLAGVAIILGFLPVENLAKGIVAMGAITLIVGMLMAMVKKLDGKVGNLIVLTVAIGVLAIAVAALSILATKYDLRPAVVALGTVMVAFGLMGKLLNSCDQMKTSIKSLAIMLGVVLALTGIVWILSKFDATNSIQNAFAVGMLLEALAGAMFILGKAGNVPKSVVGTMALLGLVVAELAVILGIMSALNVEASIGTATALSILLLAMSASLVILNTIGLGAVFIKPAIGALALLGLVVAELAIILGLMNKFDFHASAADAIILGTLILVLSEALIPLTAVGTFGGAAYNGIGALAVLIAAMGGILAGLGALDKDGKMSKLIDTGLPLLEKLGYAIGSFFGNIVGGFLGGAVGGALVSIGISLSLFMTAIQPFLAGLENIDQDKAKAAGLLVGMLAKLIGISLLDGLTSFITGGVDFKKLGRGLVDLGEAMNEFASTIQNTNVEAIEQGAKAGKALCKVLDAMPNSGGMVSWFTGDNTWRTFGKGLVEFGQALNEFAATMVNTDPEVVKKGASAITELANAQSAMENSGGMVAWFTGDNNWTQFRKGLVELGQALNEFGAAMVTTDPEAVKKGASAITELANAQSAIENSGGMVAWFTGDNNWTQFRKGLVELGQALNEFGAAMVTTSPEAIGVGVSAITELANAQSSMENMGGMAAWFAGDNNWTQFGKGLVELGQALNEFGAAMVTTNPEAVKNGATAAKYLVEALNEMPNSGGMVSWFTGDNNWKKLGTGLVEFGQTLNEFAATMIGIDSGRLQSATEQLKSIVELITSVSGLKLNGVKNFGELLGNIGKEGVQSFISAFENTESTAKKAASTFINNLIDGIKAKQTTLNEALQSAASTAATKITSGGKKGALTAFTQAGKDLAQGLINGLKDPKKLQAVYDAAFALGQKAVQGEHDGQESNSPSKATERAGKWLGEGLIIGMDAMGRKVYQSGADMGRTATNTISAAISSITDSINNDIDAQPTIRPVLDLSNVTAGAGTISGLFGNQAVGVSANLNSISSMMSNRQNGGVDDIVSAINKLNKNLSNVGGTTNHIGGITVGNDANIDAAVNTLVRAATIGGRV